MSLFANSSTFVIANRRFLGFGLLMTLGSSFGQTFFISLFSADIRNRFGLSHGDFGNIYAIATLSSAISLIWLGRKIDDLDLRAFCFFITLGLGVACLTMAWAPSVLFLGIAIYLLRLFGQGLMGHASSTSMARYYERSRGLALSVSILGYPLGEATLPLVTVTLLTFIGTSKAWYIFAAIVFCILTPLVQALLIGHGERHRNHQERMLATPTTDVSDRQWSRRDVLSDPKFYVILLVVLAPSFIATGLFFHQVHLVEVKGWELSWLATCFIAFAASQLAAGLVAGGLVDRANATRLLPWFLLPMTCALVVLGSFDHPLSALAYMILMGITSGAAATITAALWAEIYGVSHLGSIRAMATALMVCSTALSPATLGWFIDGGVSMNTLALYMAAYTAAASIFTGIWFRK